MDLEVILVGAEEVKDSELLAKYRRGLQILDSSLAVLAEEKTKGWPYSFY